MTDKQLLIRLPQDVHRALKIRAATEGASMAALVERAVRQLLGLVRKGTSI